MRAARSSQVEAHTTAHGGGAALVLLSRKNQAEALDRVLFPHKYNADGSTKRGKTVSVRGNLAAREAGKRAGALLHKSAASLSGNAARQLGGGK